MTAEYALALICHELEQMRQLRNEPHDRDARKHISRILSKSGSRFKDMREGFIDQRDTRRPIGALQQTDENMRAHNMPRQS